MIADSCRIAALTASHHEPTTRRRTGWLGHRHFKWGILALLALLAGCETTPSTPPLGNPFAVSVPRPKVGDTYIYRYSDGYGNLSSGTVKYNVDKIDGDRVIVSVTTDNKREGVNRTDIYTPDGNRLRYPLLSHNEPLDREYSPQFPAYVFPLAPGKSWSMRINATNPANANETQTVLVQAKVDGAQRIRVPAGEFDTIKITRHIFINDFRSFMNADYPTHLTEKEWYAPALGRTVRSENLSEWYESGLSPEANPRLGDWNVYELISGPATPVADAGSTR